MARVSYLPLLTLIVLSVCLSNSLTTARSHSSSVARQSPSNQASLSNALSTATLPPIGSLRKILIPALQSLVGAPVRLIRELALQVVNFLRSHTLRELYDTNFLQQVLSRLPDRVLAYWTALAAMESECMSRTVCDLSDLASRRVPEWVEKIALIYLNAFSSSHSFYSVAVQGITTHKCATLYPECDANQFLQRVQGNLTESLFATVAPMKDAFADLVNVTTTTLRSLTAVELEAADDQEFERVQSQASGRSGHRRPQHNDQDDEEQSRRQNKRAPTRFFNGTN